MRSSSPRACSARSPPANPTAARAASARPGSPPARSLEDFDFDHQRSLKREAITHLGTLDFVTAKDNVVFLGPPGTGKTHLSTGLGIRACQAGHRVAFATAAQWVARLADAHHAGTLQAELIKLGRVPLLIIDEVGYIPFEAEAANLFFQLVSSRYERARLIVTSNKPFGKAHMFAANMCKAAAEVPHVLEHQPQGGADGSPWPGSRPMADHRGHARSRVLDRHRCQRRRATVRSPPPACCLTRSGCTSGHAAAFRWEHLFRVFAEAWPSLFHRCIR